jgi:GntR family transcriptional regulator
MAGIIAKKIILTGHARAGRTECERGELSTISTNLHSTSFSDQHKIKTRKIKKTVDKSVLLYYYSDTVKNSLLAELTVDFASPLPVYEQIKKNIKQAIARNIILENQALPSIRDLAQFLKINPNTVARAYRDLTQEKIINGRAGVGFWVEKTEQLDLKKIDMLREEFMKFTEKAIEMGFSRQQIKTMLASFFPEEDLK